MVSLQEERIEFERVPIWGEVRLPSLSLKIEDLPLEIRI